MISMDKQYTTRNGQAVRLLALDAGGKYSVVGLCGDSNSVQVWCANGQYSPSSGNHPLDLVEVKKTAVLKGVMFYWVAASGNLNAQACATTHGVSDYRNYLRSSGRKFTETPFEVEVEVPSY